MSGWRCGEHDRDRCGTGGVDSDVWADIGRAIQSGGDGCRRDGGPNSVGGSNSVYCGTSGWRMSRHSAGECHVWVTSCVDFSPRSWRYVTALKRVCRDVWSGVRDLGLQPNATETRCFCCGMLHHGRVLVHGVDVVRKSSSDCSAHTQRYIRGNSTGEYSGIHRGSVCRWSCGDIGISVAGAEVGDRTGPCARTDQHENRVTTNSPWSSQKSSNGTLLAPE